MEKNFTEIWSEALELLKNEMSQVAYKTYVEVISPRLVDENTICFILPSSYHIDICKKRFLDLIENTLTILTNKSYDILFESKEIIPETNNEIRETSISNFQTQKTTKEESVEEKHENNVIPTEQKTKDIQG